MEGQLSFASLDFAGKKKRTKRDVFLAEMTAVVPWAAPRPQDQGASGPRASPARGDFANDDRSEHKTTVARPR
jgi:hypothetical protein